MRTFKALIAVLAITTCSAAAAAVDAIQLDRISSKDFVYIQRGWPANIGQCAIDNIQMITKDYQAGNLWIVLLDDAKVEITLQRNDGGHLIICQPDGQREIGTGVAGGQKYDTVIPYK